MDRKPPFLILLTSFFSEDELIEFERLREKPIDRSKKWVKIDPFHLSHVYGALSSETYSQVCALRLAHILLQRLSQVKAGRGEPLHVDWLLSTVSSICGLSPSVGAALLTELDEQRVYGH